MFRFGVQLDYIELGNGCYFDCFYSRLDRQSDCAFTLEVDIDRKEFWGND